MSDPNKGENVMLNDRAGGNNDHGGAGGGPMPSFISESSHPMVAGLHVILKILIVFLYLVLPLITTVFSQMVFIIILGAADFWIVKNVAGRLLVGLRWWIDFDEDGEEQWKFQCRVDQKQNSSASDKAFWWTMVLFTAIWIVFLVINILKFALTQVTICGFCAALLGFNIYSYYKCSKIQKDNVNRLLSQYGANAAAKFMRGSIIAGFN